MCESIWPEEESIIPHGNLKPEGDNDAEKQNIAGKWVFKIFIWGIFVPMMFILSLAFRGRQRKQKTQYTKKAKVTKKGLFWDTEYEIEY